MMTEYKRKVNIGGASQKGVRRVERISLTCHECGDGYERLPCQIKPEGSKFCSRSCQGKSKRHGGELFCALCDSSFYRAIAEQDIGEKINQFCSRDCYADWRRMNAKDSTYLKTDGRHSHRVVAESWLGRELGADEVVHHIDLDKHNNEPDNLCIFPNQSIHARCHFGKMSAEELDSFRLTNICRSGEFAI
jgi:hypothetical protein